MTPRSFPPAHPTLDRLVAYQPGKPVEELAREKGLSRIVKLASNENPLGPSPRAVAALDRALLSSLHLYPDGASFELRQALAGELSLPASSVILGNGSNEILEVLAQIFLGPGDEAVYAWPAFVVYRLATLSHGGKAVEVPLDGAMRHDLPAMLSAVTPRTRLVFINNPNNPVGTYVERKELVAFLDALPPHVLPVLDEAYFEYARDLPGFPDGVAMVREGRPLCVLRTFSKVYGLAGLRVGYGAVPPGVAALFEKVRQPFNVSRPGQVAALAALSDRDFVRRSVEVNAAERDRLATALTAMGLGVVPSAGNFLLFSLGERSGSAVYQALLDRGVIVRPTDNYGLPRHLRVTVGTPEENDIFLAALGGVLQGGKP